VMQRNIDDAPAVQPCVKRKCTDDKGFDYLIVECDGRSHINVGYRDGMAVSASPQHDCDRWRGHAQAWAKQAP